ncbi:MAG: hypothetical protein A2792_10320 [Sphingomonadales bacterium RIFCSPHIGHO2_01_FULL_65_20]|nr:MAG: hypothetical protein A2792_10320 [Sphingomonadales bacterium RIFCSPHIGHO2_01_FULL_65_20]
MALIGYVLVVTELWRSLLWHPWAEQQAAILTRATDGFNTSIARTDMFVSAGGTVQGGQVLLALPLLRVSSAESSVLRFLSRCRCGSGCGFGRRCFAATGSTEADLEREFPPTRRIIRRNHRIVFRKIPLGPIRLRGEIVMDHEVAFEHPQLLPVLETYKMVRLYRRADWNCRLLRGL